MALGGYFMSKFVFVPALLDSERLTFKNNCVKSNNHRSMQSELRENEVFSFVAINIICRLRYSAAVRTSGCTKHIGLGLYVATYA